MSQNWSYYNPFKMYSTHYKVQTDLKWSRHRRGFKFHKQKYSKAEFSHCTFSSVFTTTYEQVFKMGDDLIRILLSCSIVFYCHSLGNNLK